MPMSRPLTELYSKLREIIPGLLASKICRKSRIAGFMDLDLQRP